MFNKSHEMEEGAPQRRSYKRHVVCLVVVLAVILGWRLLVWHGVLPSGNFPAVNQSSWQAVFLTNNQVYFGHLSNYSDQYATISGIYYLRVAEPLQQGAPPQPSLSLVKLGSELHGPQDTMYIPHDKIMFWENLKSDSAIVQTINSYLAQQAK